MFEGWFRDGSGAVQGWFRDGSGMVQGWFNSFAAGFAVGALQACSGDLSRQRQRCAWGGPGPVLDDISWQLVRDGSGMVQGWFRDGSGMVQGWFRDGSGMVQGWFNSFAAGFAVGPLHACNGDMSRMRQGCA